MNNSTETHRYHFPYFSTWILNFLACTQEQDHHQEWQQPWEREPTRGVGALSLAKTIFYHLPFLLLYHFNFLVFLLLCLSFFLLFLLVPLPLLQVSGLLKARADKGVMISVENLSGRLLEEPEFFARFSTCPLFSFTAFYALGTQSSCWAGLQLIKLAKFQLIFT